MSRDRVEQPQTVYAVSWQYIGFFTNNSGITMIVLLRRNSYGGITIFEFYAIWTYKSVRILLRHYLAWCYNQYHEIQHGLCAVKWHMAAICPLRRHYFLMSKCTMLHSEGQDSSTVWDTPIPTILLYQWHHWVHIMHWPIVDALILFTWFKISLSLWRNLIYWRHLIRVNKRSAMVKIWIVLLKYQY